MNSIVIAKIYFILLFFFWGCGGSLVELGVYENGPAEGVAVRLLVDGLAELAPVRSITPNHVSKAELSGVPYTLVLEGSSDMGDRVNVPNFSVVNGTGMVVLSPGAWTLTLTAKNNSNDILVGSAFLIVLDKPSSTSITLTPIDNGIGTVNVTFTLPQSVVKNLDPASRQDKTVTVALYDGSGVAVANTQQRFTVRATDANSTITYNANNNQVSVGKYTLKLTSPYTVNNGSTNNQDITYPLTYEDILYVEHNRQTSASIVISEANNLLAIPGGPYRVDKTTENKTAGSPNFAASTPANPYEEGLWLYATHWDGKDNDGNGNEVLVVAWSPVYNADYYDLELLVHPFTKSTNNPSSNGKFDRIITNDTEWENLKQRSFQYSGQSRQTTYIRYSGNSTDSDYYKTRVWDVPCNTSDTYKSCADKQKARALFASGTQNGSYRVGQTNDAFDNYSTWSYRNYTVGKIGLEGDCSALGILLPAYTPQMSLVFRVRAVNRYGYSDWVYWKGGKW